MQSDDEGEDDRCLKHRTPKPDRSIRRRLSDRVPANTRNLSEDVESGLFIGCQLIKQRLRFLQIERVEAFSEPLVDRSEQFASLLLLPLIAPQPRHAHRCAQFPRTLPLCVSSTGIRDDDSRAGRMEI